MFEFEFGFGSSGSSALAKVEAFTVRPGWSAQLTPIGNRHLEFDLGTMP